MYPILFKVFGFPVHSYGVMIVLGFVAGIFAIKGRTKAAGTDFTSITDGLFIALFAGVIGARITFILLDLPYYSAHPKELFSPEFAGLTSFGGEILGFLALLIWAKRKKLSGLKVFDCIAPGFLIAYAVGRVGCLLNGCCYGGVTNSWVPWKIHVEGSTQWHHPAQIYEALMNLVGFGLLLWLERRNKAAGQTLGLALVIHGICRIIYEFWRGGTADEVARGIATSEYLFWKVTEAQVAAFVLLLIGTALYVLAPRWQRNPLPQTDPSSHPAPA